MRLIDADALKDYFVEISKDHDIGFGDIGRMITVKIEHVIEKIEEAPTIEPKRGEWKHDIGDKWYCSCCFNLIHTDGSWEKPTKKFCDECGADMRGKQND